MLRKIENKLNYLTEARDYIAAGGKKKDLEKREGELHNARKEERIKRKQVTELELQEERQRKNMAKIRK